MIETKEIPDWLKWQFDSETEQLSIFLKDSTLSIDKESYEK